MTDLATDHEDFDDLISTAEEEARERALMLKRIEIELGIFKPDPQIIAKGD